MTDKFMLVTSLLAAIGLVPAPLVEPIKPDPCAMVQETIKLQEAIRERGKPTRFATYDQPMPVLKAIAHESHYLVRGIDPPKVSSVTDRMKEHLARSCGLLRTKYAAFFPALDDKCSQIYKRGGDLQWTPPEPITGQGARPYTSQECELWTGNMFFTKASFPAPNTKFLLVSAKLKKAVVLCIGQELGPGSRLFAGGASTESLRYLEAGHGSVLTLGRAVDQKIPFGPIECGE